MGLAALAVTLASGLWAAAAPLEKPYVFAAGKPASAAEVNENFDALYAAINDGVIREDETINLSQADGCDGLTTALSELSEHRIAAGVSVTVLLGAGTYTCSKSIGVRHSEGRRIHIVGAGSVPAAVTLGFPPSTNGIVVSAASALGSIENLVLSGGQTAMGVGVLARTGGTVDLENLEILGFGAGISAEQLGIVTGSALNVHDNVGDGVRTSSGYVELTNTTSSSNGGSGFEAYNRGMMLLAAPTAQANSSYGLSANFGGAIRYSGTAALEDNVIAATELETGVADVAGSIILD